MPQMGYDMQDGTVVRWLKSEGSQVNMGEPVAEIETDKAIVEFESYASGILGKILVPEGTKVPVGQAIAVVIAQGEALGETLTAKNLTPPSKKPSSVSSPKENKTNKPTTQVREAKASPVARRLAEEHGIDLSQITGSGPRGRITKEDVLNAHSPLVSSPSDPKTPTPGKASGKRIPLSRMRHQIARVTAKSKQEKPHFYVTSEIDMTKAIELRHHLNQRHKGEGIRISINDLIIKACIEALKKYPNFNAYFHDDGIEMNDKINIGVAIAEEEGLIVPAIMDCNNRPLTDISRATRDLAERAKNGTLRSEEYSGGTFAISNLGMFDISSFIAIIQPPQSAVLAVGTVTKTPVVREDQIVVAQMMNASLSCDHRIVDGAEGARFIVEIKRLLEYPIGLAV